MSRGIDFTSNYTGGDKIIRPTKKVRQAPIKTQPQEVKSKTFSINKSFQIDNTSQTYKKHISPAVLNQIKQMEIDKKKEDERMYKQTIEKQKIKQQETNKNQIRDDIRIDQQGRTIDKDGNLVLIQKQLFSTLINQKLNKKQHKKELEKKTKKKAYQKASKLGFQDNNIAGSTKRRLRRTLAGLQFEDDEDVYQKQEDKGQLQENLQDLLAPKIQKAPRKLKKIKRTKLQTQQLIPEKQWWDAQLIPNPSYFQIIKNEQGSQKLKQLHTKNIQNANQTIKNIIDFSRITGDTPQFELFADVQQKPVIMPIFLTKDQQKKLKRMRKRQKLKQKNDKIKLGMVEPDKPKLKISNMAQVMKQEYILDPSRVELEVKKQIQGRLDTHNQTNEARKLTKQKKAEKALRKLKRDSAKETRIAVFRIDDVKDRTHRFKIQMNAKQLAINGLFLFPSQKYKGPAVIIAQGGRRAIKFYKNLLMNRIQWSSIDKANLVARDQENQQEVEHQRINIRNRCHLVWEAVINDTLFTKWRAVQISNQPEAIRALAQRKAEHFWDMIINFKQEA